MATNGSNNYTLTWNDHHVAMQQEFKKRHERCHGDQRDEFADVKVITEDGGVFYCHSVVVAMGTGWLGGVLEVRDFCWVFFS